MVEGSDQGQEKYTDYIANESSPISFIDSKYYDLLDDYNYLLVLLRSGPQTVKELQNKIESNPDIGDQSIMTLYRHLNKLEESNIVIVAGYRKTEGLRTTEKLYARSGKIYFPNIDEDFIDIWEADRGKEFSKQLYHAIQVVYTGKFRQVDKTTYEKFFQLYKQIYYNHHQAFRTVLQNINKNPEFADQMTNENIDYFNTLNNIGGTLIALLQNPEYYKELESFFK